MLNLRTTHKKALELLIERINEVKKIKRDQSGCMNIYQSMQWIQTTIFVLEEIYIDKRHAKQFLDTIKTPLPSNRDPKYEGTWAVNFGLTTLNSFVEEIDFIIKNPEFHEPYIFKIPLIIQSGFKDFKKDYPEGQKTAFIMMQFGETINHKEILTVIKTILSENGIIGLRADDMSYHEDVYYNISTYLHGCDFGIAVFETIEDPSFNPNVCFEIGYLKGLNKPVCLLKEKSVIRLPTDLVGKKYDEFDKDNCDFTIGTKLNDWLYGNNFTRPNKK